MQNRRRNKDSNAPSKKKSRPTKFLEGTCVRPTPPWLHALSASRAATGGTNRKAELRGYVTTAVVSVLAILSLLATRASIVATLETYRVAGDSQGIAATLFAAEVALQDSVDHIELNPLSQESCRNHPFGPVDVTDPDDASLTRSYDMQYYAEYLESTSGRDLYRIYAIASVGSFAATVSQIISVDANTQGVYLLPGTWAHSVPQCE